MAAPLHACRRAPLVAFLAVAMAACGSDAGDELPPVPPPVPGATTQPAGDLTPLIGRYRMDAGSREPQLARGPWHLSLGPERFNLESPSGARVSGRYSVDGQTASFTSNDCGNEPGRYRWTAEGEALTFETLEDACSNRRAALTALPWRARLPGASDDRSTNQRSDESVRGGRFGLDADASTPKIASGRWTLDLSRGRFELIQPDGTSLDGRYELRGDEVLLSGGPCGDDVGRYEWAQSGAILTFNLVEDACGNRSAILTAKPWDSTAD